MIVDGCSCSIGASYVSPNCLKPIFVSVGHSISLQASLEIVEHLCVFRVPEPIRVADKTSRTDVEMYSSQQMEKAEMDS